jgi:hypothetical protein
LQRQRPSGDWGTKPVSDKQVKNLKDLPEGEGKYYLSYYEGKHRQMPPVGRFADAARQKLIQKRKELDARATGVEIPPEIGRPVIVVAYCGVAERLIRLCLDIDD